WISKLPSARSSPNSLVRSTTITTTLADAKSHCACCSRTAPVCPLTKSFSCAPRSGKTFCKRYSPRRSPLPPVRAPNTATLALSFSALSSNASPTNRSPRSANAKSSDRSAGRKRQHPRWRRTTRRSVLDRRRSSYLRPRHAQRRTPHLALHNYRTIFATRIRARGYFTRAGLGHAVFAIALAIRKILLARFLRAPRLHWHIAVDRPRPPTLSNFAN